MKKYQAIIVGVLLVLPISLVLYKVQFLNQDFLPVGRDDIWKIQIQLTPLGIDQDLVTLPLPQSESHFSVKRVKTVGPAGQMQKNTQQVHWRGVNSMTKLGYQAEVQLRSLKNRGQIKDRKTKGDIQRYLRYSNLNQDVEELLDNLLSALIFTDDQDKEKVRKIFDYFTQEVQLKSNVTDLKEALLSGKASKQLQNEIFSLLVKKAGVPARIVMGIFLDPEQSSSRAMRKSFALQVLIGNEWIPVDIHSDLFGSYADRFIPLFLDYEKYQDYFENPDFNFKIFASTVKVTKFDKGQYGDKISKVDSWVNWWNLYQLPLGIQTIFYALFFIPLGAVILSFMRNMVGVPTFGIFTPLLLTLFFMEAGAVFGLIFFAAVIIIGLSERLWLDKLYLLAVPRLSILLTLMILFLLTYALVAHHYFPNHKIAINVYPVVIMTVIIERFSITLIENGYRDTFKTLLGTLSISYLCLLVFHFSKLQIFLFTYPETQLFFIGVLILIGDYKGYRLSEIFRFSPFIKKQR